MVDEFKVFRTFKERGEWVELRFMAEALRHGFKVLKPWGDSSPFDVALHFGSRIIRVQVKSTSCRVGTGYFCQFKPNYLGPPYTLKQLDFFAAYVIMQDTWYLIPARVLLGGDALKQACECYESAMAELRANGKPEEAAETLRVSALAV